MAAALETSRPQPRRRTSDKLRSLSQPGAASPGAVLAILDWRNRTDQLSDAVVIATIASISVFMLGTNLGVLYFIGHQLAGRLDRIEERLTALELTVARIGQRLEDHIENHPGPSRRVS